ncbi:SMI1/KNR4 family protein [Paenibacillus sp. UNC451MF]|uniref:SMI1/KNR4 family protein n=1 Tax=Paenibacillus sp. UNC451MF TaxID=1449063 RepID=UPI000ACD9188|nr:SMI1/KNR4 family protein [Paenibacillus sp. UNC451MF]
MLKDELMERLYHFFGKEDNTSLVAVPANDEQIADAELRLHVTFHADYIQFIKAFGGGYAGLPVHAFSNGNVFGNETVVELTMEFRQQFMGSAAGKQLQDGYVISMNGCGDPIMLNSKEEVLICYHDSGEMDVVARSFAELIESNFYEW